MTLPSAPQIGSTGFIQQPGISEQIAPFLQLLMAKEEMALRKEKLKLDKQEMESRLSQQAMDAQNQQALGQGLLQALLATETQPTPLPQAPGMMAMPQGMTIPTLSPIGQAAQQLPARAVPAFVEQTRDMRRQAAEARARADQLAVQERALAAIPDPARREAAASLLAFAESGLNLSATEQQTLFPALRPLLDAADPQRVNAMTNFMRITGAPLGTARRVVGITTPIPGVDDQITVPRLPRGSVTGEQQRKSVTFLGIMRPAYATISGLVNQTGTAQGITLTGSFRDAIRKNVPWAVALNEIPDAYQQQLLNAVRSFVDARRYFLSGQQTTDQEFINQYITLAPFENDDPVTRSQKLAAMQSTIDAMESAVTGEVRASQSLERTIRTARAAGWHPDIIKALEQQLAEARAFEVRVQRLGQPMILGDQPDGFENEASVRDWLLRNVPR